MPDQITDVKQFAEETFKLIEDLQSDINTIGDKADAFDQEKFNKMSEAATTATEKIQEFEAQLKSQEDQTKAIEKFALQNSNGGDSKEFSSEEEKEYHFQVDTFVRLGTPIDPDVHENYIRQFAESICVTASEKMKTNFANEMVSGIDPNGGYVTLPDRKSRVLTRIFETSPVRQVATVEQTNSNQVVYLIDDDEAEVNTKAGEVDVRTGNTKTPSLGELKIDVIENYAEPIMTNRQLQDASIDVEGWLSNKIARKLMRAENRQFVIGSGNEECKGFMNEDVYPAWSGSTYEREKLETITTTGAAGAPPITDDLINVQGSLLQEYQNNATWMMNRKTWYELLKLKTTFKQPLFSMQFLADGYPKLHMLGDPVILATDISTIAAGALSIAYGDFREGYTIVDRLGINVIRDNLTRKGFTKFYTTKRLGAGVTSFQSIKRLKIKA